MRRTSALERTPAGADVEITFIDHGDDTTRVEIEQRGWERLGNRGQTWRARNHAGWGGVLPHFVEACIRLSS